MSEPANPDPFEMLPDLGAERPDFEEPWQGEALALVVSLHRAGYFEWREWVGALSTEIAHDAASTSERPYYQQWLAAIEKLLAAKELVADGERETRKRAWRVNRRPKLTPNRRAILTPLSGTAEVVPVVNRGDPSGFV